MASPPPPRASGASWVSRPPSSAPAAGRISISQGRKTGEATALTICSPWARRGEKPASRSRRKCWAYSSPAKNAAPTSPAASPTSAVWSNVRPRICTSSGGATAQTSENRLRSAVFAPSPSAGARSRRAARMNRANRPGSVSISAAMGAAGAASVVAGAGASGSSLPAIRVFLLRV
jgi:hypothetical protein